MSIVRNHRLIKETITIKRADFPNIDMDESTASFIINRYFHYGLLALMHGFIFGSKLRFSVKMKCILYYQIPKKFRRIFTYSSRLFGYTFFPVLTNINATRFGYNFKPDPGLLKRIAEVTDNDKIYKLIKK